MDLVEKSGVPVHPRLQASGLWVRADVRFALTMPAQRIAEAVKAIRDSGILG